MPKNTSLFDLQAVPMVQQLGTDAREKLAHVVRTGTTRGASNLSELCLSALGTVIKCVK